MDLDPSYPIKFKSPVIAWKFNRYDKTSIQCMAPVVQNFNRKINTLENFILSLKVYFNIPHLNVAVIVRLSYFARWIAICGNCLFKNTP